MIRFIVSLIYVDNRISAANPCRSSRKEVDGPVSLRLYHSNLFKISCFWRE